MARTVTSAIVQVAWTGDKESMIELHEVTEELVVRDLDQIEEVRSQWAFYRDRRPDLYGALTAP